MRKLGIGYYLNSAATDMQYGSSDGSTSFTAVTSTTVVQYYGYPADPSLLAEGSIGIFGDAKDGTGLYLLYTSTTLSNFTSFMIYQGGKSEIILLAQFLGSELQTINSAAYLCPTKQVSFIGWNGTSGSLNLGTTVAGDSGQIQLNQRNITNNPISTYFLIGDSGKLAAAATGYAALAPTLAQLNNTRGTTSPLKGTWQTTCNATTLTANASTATVLKFTKGSTTVTGYIDDSTSGLVTTSANITVAAGDVISVPTSMKGVTFTSPYTSAKNTMVTIGDTIYLVADTTSATVTGALIATAINAGTQAYASSSAGVVTITLLPSVYSAKITVRHITAASTGADTTLTTINSTGDMVPTIYKAAAAVTAGASFELDYPFQGTTGFYSTGTGLLLTTGVATVITEYGAKFSANNYFEEFTHQLNGSFSNATLTYGNGTVTSAYTTLTVSGATVSSASVALKPTSGSGEFSEMRLLEDYGRYYRGANDTYPAVSTSPKTYYTKTGKGYDNYSIVIQPMRVDGSGLNATSSNQYNLDMGFEHFNLTASTGDNQYVWEAILDLFVTAYPNLAYTSLV